MRTAACGCLQICLSVCGILMAKIHISWVQLMMAKVLDIFYISLKNSLNSVIDSSKCTIFLISSAIAR